jgi:predicted ester cyclase
MSETSKAAAVQILERMLHEGFATGDTAVVDELCAPHIVEHQFGMQGEGPEAIAGIKQCIRDVHAAFPDVRYTIQAATVDGDTVWVCAEGTATNSGPFFGPPTGLPVRFTVMDAARIVDGRIVEHWGVPDRFALLMQVGILGARRQETPTRS